MRHLIPSSAWILWIVLLMAQAVLSFFLYNPAGSQALRIVGWMVGVVAGLFGVLPMITLRSKGGMPTGKDYTHTTVLVDSGVYAIVRHPQYLSFMLLSVFLLLVAQHWLIAILSTAAIVSVYVGIVPQADRDNIEKFGEEYKGYRWRVPGVNLPAGLIRLLQRRARMGKERER